MHTRMLGRGLEVSAVGLGAMGFSHGYGPGVAEDEAVDLLRAAFDLGCTFYDTAEGYADGANVRLVGRAVAVPVRRTSRPSVFSFGPDDGISTGLGMAMVPSRASPSTVGRISS